MPSAWWELDFSGLAWWNVPWYMLYSSCLFPFFFFGQGSQGGVWPLYISTIIQLFIASELKHSFLKREGPEAHMT